MVGARIWMQTSWKGLGKGLAEVWQRFGKSLEIFGNLWNGFGMGLARIRLAKENKSNKENAGTKSLEWVWNGFGKGLG